MKNLSSGKRKMIKGDAMHGTTHMKKGGEIGKELMGGQPNSEPKPSGAILLEVKGSGKEIIVSEDGGKTKERYVKNNGYSGYTLRYNGNQYEFVDSMAKGGRTSKFRVDEIVYNKRTNTVGIVRLESDDQGITKTDADGNVNTSELQLYNPLIYKKQENAQVAPSTKREIDSRNLWKPFRKYVKGGTMAKGGNLKAVWAEYEENEDNNYHSENVVLLAKHFGTKDDLKEANAILKAHDEAGSLTDDLRSRRNKLNDKLWPIAKEKMEAAGVFAKGGTMNKAWSRKIDKSMKAKRAGYRKSKETGNYYYEDRPNRSDKDPQARYAKGGAMRDNNLANNYPPYDKVTRGDVIAGRLGQDQMGGKNKMEMGGKMYAKGGMTEHGLKTGDKIVGKSGSKGVKIYNKDSREAGSINLDSGSRSVSKYAKGGYMKKGGKSKEKEKDPPIIRSYVDDEGYEYGQGGNTGNWSYGIGGL